MTTPWDATSRALAGGHRSAVALRLGVSDSTVDGHCVAPKEYDGPGLACPAQRVIETYLELVSRGATEQAREFVSYIARECGHVAFLIEAKADPTSLECVAALMREHADILNGFAAAHEDGRFTGVDAERLILDVDGALRVLLPLRVELQRISDEDAEARLRARRGPHRTLPKLIRLRNEARRATA